MSKKKKIIGVVCGVVAVAVVGGYLLLNQNSGAAVMVSTETLQQMDLQNTVSLTGVVESETDRKVYSTLSYLVESVNVQVGDVVQIRSMGVKATVLAISSDRTLTLQAGILRVTAREDEVLLLENEKPAVTVRTESRGTALRQSAVSSELDIRGMETIEAIPVVERYIDSAVQSRLETVTIIHGKGTGALRAAVQQSLRRNKQVKSFRLGRYGEGETGVTVVELK